MTLKNALIVCGLKTVLMRCGEMESGFLPGIFSRGDKIYCYANFFCYANFSIVFGPNFGGGVSEGGKLPQGQPPVEESQGIQDDTLYLVYLMNRKAHVTVKTPFGDSDPFTTTDLVKQGTCLGLVLNNCSVIDL